MINRKFFFEEAKARLFNGALNTQQQATLTNFLNVWEADPADYKDPRWLAYMLATTYHETDKKFKAIEEYGKGKGRKYGTPHTETGKVYYGRGYVQLTWDYNYKKMSDLLGVDLYHNPELALQDQYATPILFTGMSRGLFTGKKLSDYFNGTKEDWVNARKIINGLDKANIIADYGRKFYASISMIP